MRRSAKTQNLKNSRLEQAEARGVLAIRRAVSAEGQTTLQSISDLLMPEVINSGRLFDVVTLGVTVVGFSRFDKHHRSKGPPTRQVVENIQSLYSPTNVKLGKLGIFGSEAKSKLGIYLTGDALFQEAEDIDTEFMHCGFPLRNDPNSPDGFVPHCSIALLYTDNIAHFREPRTLKRLNIVAGLAAATKSIDLDAALK